MNGSPPSASSPDLSATGKSPTPHKPRPTVHVGISGHRFPAAGAAEIKAAIRQVFLTVRQLTQDILKSDECAALFEDKESPVFRLISPLAEGADRMAAEVALSDEFKFDLQAPLPMERAVYAQTFECSIKDENGKLKTDAQGKPVIDPFDGLLDKASAIFEIEAAHNVNGHAFSDAGRVMLNHSDLLVAVWDGKDTGHIAGTAATIGMAMSSHIPVIHIDSARPDKIVIIKDGFVAENWTKELENHLRLVLLPGAEAASYRTPLFTEHDFIKLKGRNRSLLGRIRLEKAVSWCIEKVGKSVALFGVKFGNPPAAPMEADTSYREHHERFVTEFENNPFSACYRTFDECSAYYSLMYRNCLVTRFIAPVFAMIFLVMALYGAKVCADFLNVDSYKWLREFGSGLITGCFMCQMGLLFYVIILALREKTRWQWHKKFFSCRVMAELFRQNMFLWTIGYCNVRYRHRSYRKEESKWTMWYFRALARQAGLPHTTVSREKIETWLDWIQDKLVIDQMNYHGKRSHREGRLAGILLGLGVITFMGGIACSFIRAFCFQDSAFWAVGAFLLPAFAVFFTGYCNHMGYPSNQMVSKQTGATLNAISEDIRAMRSAGSRGYRKLHRENVCYSDAHDIAERIHDCCADELMEWEALISTKKVKYN